MEWMWADTLGKKMRSALLEEDWGVVAMTSAEIAGRLAKVEALKKLAGEEPWIGSWKKLKAGEQAG